MSTFFNDVKEMHKKFGISSNNPNKLSKKEYAFRIGAMFEEVLEYATAVFNLEEDGETVSETINGVRNELVATLLECGLRKDVDSPTQLAEQLDACVDLSVFAMGTAERQGFDFNKAWSRVHAANMAKELATKASDSKRDFEIDLVKPEGWQAPDLTDLVKPLRGIIVLEGPDAAGKTTLANTLIEKFGGSKKARYIHSTWSPELEKVMDDYHLNTIHRAIELSRSKVVILDRSWLSELVYSEVFRSGTNFPDLAREAHTLLSQANATYVLCCPFLKEEYLANFEKTKSLRTEMYTSMEKCYDAFAYLVFNRRTGCNNLPHIEDQYSPQTLAAFDNAMREDRFMPLVCDFISDPDYADLMPAIVQNLKRGR